MLQGCPDDGPAMGAEERGRVHIVWPTVVTDQGTPQKVLFHASSVDGRTFTARTRLPVEGQANHPQIAVARDGMLLLAWDEVHGGERRIVVARGRQGWREFGAAGFPARPIGRRSRRRLSCNRAHADNCDRRVDERIAGGLDHRRAPNASCSLGTEPSKNGILRRSK